MKKLLSFGLTIIASTHLATVSATENNKWYMGGIYSAQDLAGISSDDREFSALGLIAGYQYNEYISVETRLSKGVSGAGYNEMEEFNYSADINYQGSVLMKASYPLTDEFNLYATAGYAKTKIDQAGTIPVFAPDSFEIIDSKGFNTSLTESGFTYGVGLSYEFNDKLNVFADYQVLPTREWYVDGSEHWNSINIGFSYAF